MRERESQRELGYRQAATQLPTSTNCITHTWIKKLLRVIEAGLFLSPPPTGQPAGLFSHGSACNIWTKSVRQGEEEMLNRVQRSPRNVWGSQSIECTHLSRVGQELPRERYNSGHPQFKLKLLEQTPLPQESRRKKSCPEKLGSSAQLKPLTEVDKWLATLPCVTPKVPN